MTARSTRILGRALVPVLLLAIAGCTAQQATDAVLRQTAQTVVTPVLDDFMTPAQAVTATDCVMVAATSADPRLLSRDVGVIAGTSTVNTVLSIAARPAARDCMARSGLPALPAPSF